MKKLTRKEEEIMQVLWSLEKAFIKDIVDALPEPKPHYNTVSTVLKILKEKEFVTNERYGNVYQYKPLVTEDTYKTDEVDDIIGKYFDNSYTKMIAHFANKEKISEDEIKEILQLIQAQKQ